MASGIRRDGHGAELRIRKAYEEEDVELSIAAHDERAEMIVRAEETHASQAAGEIVKSLIFGGLDGIITTFAIVAAVAGAGLSENSVILLGVANLVADGISMGLGDYLSEVAEQNFVRHEFKRERWEVENYMEGEIREMCEIYTERKGFSKQDAEDVMRIFAKYPKAFVELMCVDELGFIAPSEDDDFPAWKKGLVTMLAFDFFGSVPVLIFIIAKALPASQTPEKHVLFIIATIATALTMFALGLTKASFTKQNKMKSGLMMLLNGACAAAAAFAIGYILESMLKI